jgi:hypothetical protein
LELFVGDTLGFGLVVSVSIESELDLRVAVGFDFIK